MYHYAGNNPVKYTDPDGRVPQAAAALWVVLFVAVTLEAYLQTPAGQQGCQALCEAISYGAESATKTISNAIAALGTAVLDVEAVIENYAKNKTKGKTGSKGESEALPKEGAKSGEKPESLTPPGSGRRGALREAKRKNNIPTSQPPQSQGPNHDRKGNEQPGREYDYKDSDGRPVKIRDDANGHTFPDNPSQNRGPHFNDPQGNHYDY